MAVHPYVRIFPNQVTAPTVSDDSTQGYEQGDIWIDVVGNNSYQCINPAAGAAVWSNLSSGGTGDAGNEFHVDQSGGTSDTYGVLAGAVNGVNTVFTVAAGSYVSGQLTVYLNGQLQTQGTAEDWVQTSPAAGTFTFNTAPLTGDLITASYTRAATALGNADTLDGFDATHFAAVSDILTTEAIQDIIGDMVTGNTETGITVTYDDTGGKLNFSVTIPTTEDIEDIIGAMVTGNTETGIAVTYDDATSKLNFSVDISSQIREKLTGDRTYYVRTDGSDSNNGLANTSGGAFLTIQKAIDVVCNTLDIMTYNVTIQVGDGTYTQSLTLKQYLGNGTVTLQGNAATPANVVVTTGAGNTITLSSPCTWTVKDLKIQGASGGKGLYVNIRGGYLLFGNLNFGTITSGYHMQAENGQITCISNYAISGGAGFHQYSNYSGSITIASKTVTITGTPAFTTYAYADCLSTQVCHLITFSGSATGKRYDISQNSMVFTLSGGANYFPGNSAGTTATGGLYL